MGRLRSDARRSRRWRAAAMVGAAGALVGCSPSSGSAEAAPPIVATAIDGSSWSLSEQRSHWTVVAFQAEWCAPCRAEVRELKALAAQRPEVRIVTIAYASDEREAQEFARANDVPWPVLPDAQGRIAEKWKVVGLPATAIVDPDTRLVQRFTGGLTAAKISSLMIDPDLGNQDRSTS